MRIFRPFLWLGRFMAGLAALSLATHVVAQQQASGGGANWAEGAQLVTSLSAGHQPIGPERVAQTHAALRQAVNLANANLGHMSPDDRAAWSEHLNWETFGKTVDIIPPNLAVLNKTLVALNADRVGIEAAHWSGLREKLERYMYLAQFAADPKAADAFSARVEQLAKAVLAVTTDPRSEEANQIGRLLGWFDRYEQHTATIAKLRSHFAQPNLVATVSAKLVSRSASRQISRTLPINDVILGTTIHGSAHTTANISLGLIPSANRIGAEVRMTGNADSKNTGWNRGVQIRSSGSTSIYATKPIYVTLDEITTGMASAKCSTTTQIQAICHQRRLVEKIAWKKACESKSQAECIANQRAEERIRQELDNEVRKTVAESRHKLTTEIRNPILRRNAMPRFISTSSDSQRAWIRLLQANASQISATAAAPFAIPTADVAVQVHESLAGNLSEVLIGGLKLTDELLAEKIEEAGREVPEELKIRDDTDPWSITFSRVRPISVRFDDDQMVIVVRGAQFTRGSTTVTRDMEISATYTVQRTDAGLRLQRQGEVDAAYVKQGAEGFGDIAIKTLMRTKFSALFKEEIETSGMKLPGPLEGKGELQMKTFNLGQGWAVVGWDLADVVAKYESVTTYQPATPRTSSTTEP